MAALYLLIAAAVLTIPVGVQAYDRPKDALLMVGCLPVMGYSFVRGVHIGVPPHVLYFLVGLCVWLLVRSSSAWLPKTAFYDSVLRAAVAALCVAAVSTTDVKNILIALSLCACLNSLLIILQVFKVPVPCRAMVSKRSKIFGLKRWAWKAIGFCGNDNMAGIFQVPCLFAAMQLEWWWAALFIALGLALTQCRVAVAAAITGLVSCISVPLAVVGFAAVVIALRKTRTLSFRWRYWQAAFYTLRSDFFLGCGPNCWKSHIPVARYAIGDLAKKPMVSPRRCHNDFIQALLDGGVICLALLVCLYVSAYFSASGFLQAAVLAMAVCGLGFHCLSIQVLMVPFLLTLLCGVSGSGWAVLDAPELPFFLMLLVPLVVPYTSAFVADILVMKSMKEPDSAVASLYTAEQIDPLNPDVQMRLLLYERATGQEFSAYSRVSSMIRKYEGEWSFSYLLQMAEELWDACREQEPYRGMADLYRGC